MWKTIQIFGTAMLAVLAVIMQIKPDDAQSNLSAWLSLVIDNVPSSFISPNADKWAFVILALAALLLGFGPWLYKRIKKSGRTSQAVIKTSFQAPDTEHVSAVHADKFPDIRVADSSAVLKLFSGPERIKLIALLESGSIQSWARSMDKGQTPSGFNTDLLMLKPEIWSLHNLQIIEGEIKQTFLKTNDRGYSRYYDLWLNSVQIKQAFPNFNTQHPNAPDLQIITSGGITSGVSKRTVLSIDVTNLGGPGEVTAKIGPPFGYLSSRANRQNFLAPAPAVWSGKSTSTIRMHNGSTESIVVGIVDGESRIIDVPHFDDDGNKSSWKLNALPVGEQFVFEIRLEFTADPRLNTSPLRKKVSFDLTIRSNGQVAMLTDPSKVQEV